MQAPSEILGKTLTITASDAVHLLESAISEGILTPAGWNASSVEHIFGRTPNRFTSSDLSFLLGMASSGLRTVGFLQGDDLMKNFKQVGALSRQHLGVVLHFTGGHADYHAVAGAGCFQLTASNAQEAIDFAMIAHRVAELSLVPGIVNYDPESAQPAQFPDRRTIQLFLGDPDERIPCPTPAQEMIFGETRRRIPNWFNFDFPTINGVQKEGNALSLEAAARQRFFYHHLLEIIGSAFAEYATLSGRKYAPVSAYKAEDADYLILTQGTAFRQAIEAVNNLRSTERAKVGCLNLSLLRPFPAAELANLVSGKKAVTVLEVINGQQSGEPPIFSELKAAVEGLGKKMPMLLSGSTAFTLSSRPPFTATSGEGVVNDGQPDSLKAVLPVFKNMMAGEKAKRHFYLGINFTRPGTDYPQHEVLLQTIGRAYPGIGEETLPEASGFNRGAANTGRPVSPKQEEESQLGLPLIARKHKNLGPPYSKLSRFYHDTAYFFGSGEEDELVADPFQALPVMPATTATLAGMDTRRMEIPVFLPEHCTGCGQCFVLCPHSAIPPIALNTERLLRGGMDIAAKQGLSVSTLTPLVKNLGKVATQVIRKAEMPVTQVADFLPIAFENLCGQLKLEGEKLDNARRDFEHLLSAIKDFPVAVTETFFTQNEIREKGSGELFSLAIDPHSCTGCSLCAQICPEEALIMTEQSPELLGQTDRTFNLWEQLPDTSSDTIRRQLHNEEYNSFGAILLSRFNYLSMAGGSLTESGASVKTLLHWLMAMTESTTQPGVVEQVREIEKLIESLSENIHEKLSGALPKEDSGALWKAISDAKGRRLPFDEIVAQLGTEEHLKLVDTAVLQRKIQLVNDLKELRWILTEGPNGMGRSRFGLALNDGILPGNTYPFNAFTTPVIIGETGVTAELAEGLFKGYLRHMLDNLKLLRRARLEAKDQYLPDAHAQKIAALRWEDLEEGEKRLVPPMLLVGSLDSFLEKNFTHLNTLLASDFPIKIIALNDGLVPPGSDTAVHFSKNNTLLLSALTLRKASVFQGVMDGKPQLFSSLLKGLQHPGPALFHLLAPNHGQHTATDWTELPDLALGTRAFPFFRFDPSVQGGFLSTQTSLDGNPSQEENQHAISLHFLENEEQKSQSYTLTLADWLFRQVSWASHFRPALPDEANMLPVADLLTLDAQAREGKVPVILSVSENGELQRWITSRQVVEAAQAAENQWHTLREIAGRLTPYPEKLWKEAEAALTKKFDARLADLQADYEQQLSQQEAEFMEQVKVKLREKLLALSKRQTV